MKSIVITTALLLILAGPALARAATEGDLDDRSEGTLQISLSILPTIEIDTVADIHLNITDRSVDTRFSESFCVIGNDSGRYRVVPYGSESAGDNFLLRNAEGEALEYQVSFLGDPGRGEYDPLSPGRESPVYELFTSEAACDGQTAFRITFLSEDLQAAGSGLYNGDLTLVVSPE